MVTKKQTDSKPEKNSILLEYKQYIDALDKSSSYNYRQDTIDAGQSTEFHALGITF